MVCQRLDELEGDFLQARAESQDVDSLGWTDRELSCLHAILDHKREGHQGEPCAEDSAARKTKLRCQSGGRSSNWDTAQLTQNLRKEAAHSGGKVGVEGCPANSADRGSG
jgi:hypothetical protein